MGTRTLRWHKGHGTENDFVLLPDPDGRRHPDLGPELVRLLCHRRRGVGADGVLRVVRTDAAPAAAAYADRAEWFMDFRNADGSIGEMCGNGVRVFARYLADAGLVDPSRPLPVATRGGLKTVTYDPDGRLSVDMEVVRLPRAEGLRISLREQSWPGVAVDVSNPHAVAFVADPDALGDLSTAGWMAYGDVFPAGVNIEFATRRGERHLAMRVLERGVGETRSCGTGACAVAAAAAAADGFAADGFAADGATAEAMASEAVGSLVTYRVDVPGGTLEVTLDRTGRARLTGPAEVYLSGEIIL